MAEAITIWTSIDDSDIEDIEIKYPLSLTGEQARQLAAQSFGQNPDLLFPIQFRDSNGVMRPLAENRKLSDQERFRDAVSLLIRREPRSEVTSGFAPHPDRYISRYYVDFNDYEVGESLDRGTYKNMCKVPHKRTGDVYAMKEIFPNRADPTQRTAFEREVQLLATVRHPAILRVVGCTPFDDPRPRILMPLMPASLQQYIDLDRDGRTPAEFTATRKYIILLGIASGMEFMHKKGYIHCNLNPENVFLDAACEPQIANFMFVEHVHSDTSLPQSIHGRAQVFLAPEIIEQDDVNSSVDVYAFAFIAYALLVKREFFPGAHTPHQVLRRVTNNNRPEIPADLPRPYANLIQDCWPRSPANRLDFCAIVRRLTHDQYLTDAGIDAAVVREYAVRVCSGVVVPMPVPVSPPDRTPAPPRERTPAPPPERTPPPPPEPTPAPPRDRTPAPPPEPTPGSIEGEVRRAHCLLCGEGCVRDVAAAAQLYKHAADAGHGLAANQYGELLERGSGVARNPAEAFRYYQISSGDGCAAGMVNLASMYHSRRHVRQDVPEAIRLYELAASEGLENAFFGLCEIFRDGAGPVPKDSSRAAAVARASAARGFFRGIVQLAHILKSGKGGSPDCAIAKELFRHAHDARHAEQQNGYADALACGKGCAVNLKKAFEYYKIAAKNRSVPAMNNVGLCYARGSGVGANARKAAQWFKQSAEAGDPDGWALFGEALQFGRGVSQDFAEAERWFRRGIVMENTTCLGSLARMYRDGQGRRIDYTEARRYFGLAAAHGLAWAMVELGVLCENGLGDRANPEEAAMHYRRAMDLGAAEGAERLGGLYENGDGVPKDLNEASKHYQRAIDLGSPTAGAAMRRIFLIRSPPMRGAI
jgi:TPR repeat protein/serine/threonine protein kinase